MLRHRSEEIAAEMIWAARGEAAPDDDEWDEEALGPEPLRSISAEETEAQCRGALDPTMSSHLSPVAAGRRPDSGP